MAHAAIAADVPQAVDRAHVESSKLSLYEVVLREVVRKRRDLLFSQVSRSHSRVHPQVLAHFRSGSAADSKDISHGDVEALIVGDVYTVYAGHMQLRSAAKRRVPPVPGLIGLHTFIPTCLVAAYASGPRCR